MKSRVLRLAVNCVLGGAASLGIASVAAAGNVSVSVNVAAPGVYGQINLGDLPHPELLVARPIIAVPARVVVGSPPPEALYLHVPPGYEKHWSKHCHEYNACGRPVYFVSDRWYHDVYTPHRNLHDEGHHVERDRHAEHAARYEHDRGHEHDHDRGHEHDHDHDHDHH